MAEQEESKVSVQEQLVASFKIKHNNWLRDPVTVEMFKIIEHYKRQRLSLAADNASKLDSIVSSDDVKRQMFGFACVESLSVCLNNTELFTSYKVKNEL